MREKLRNTCKDLYCLLEYARRHPVLFVFRRRLLIRVTSSALGRDKDPRHHDIFKYGRSLFNLAPETAAGTPGRAEKTTRHGLHRRITGVQLNYPLHLSTSASPGLHPWMLAKRPNCCCRVEGASEGGANGHHMLALAISERMDAISGTHNHGYFTGHQNERWLHLRIIRSKS